MDLSSPPNAAEPIRLIRAFAQLFRWPIGLIAAAAGCATMFVLEAATPVSQYLLTAIVLACMTWAACAINDYWDIEKDRIDHPERPLPSGALSRSQAWWAAVIGFSSAVVAAIPLGLYPLLLVMFSSGLLWHYSHLLRYSGILGNLIVAFIITDLILLGGLVTHRPFALLYPACFLFIYALAKEIIWDVHDAAGDRSLGIVTLANHWGDRVALAVAWSLLGGLLVSLPVALYRLPWQHPLAFALFALLLLVSLGVGLGRYQRQRSLEAYQNFIFWERFSMVFGVLALFAAAPVS
ncbi:MAG TPA: geranylgeranylglycerol-phosphate geranylgeranyltransferase [Coleofasciculaceae cyanobacterium]